MKKFICFMAILASVLIFSNCASNSTSYIASENNTNDIFDEMIIHTSNPIAAIETLEFNDTLPEMFFYVQQFYNVEFSCPDFITSSFFEFYDTMHERFPGQTGHYEPVISAESHYNMLSSIDDAIANGITSDQLRELIYSIRRYHWDKYPLKFTEFPSSEDIISIFNSNGTIYFQRD